MIRSAIRVIAWPGAWAILVTAALATFANASVFTLVNSLLLRPLPYPEGERLVSIGRRHPDQSEVTALPGTACRLAFPKVHLESVACYTKSTVTVGDSTGSAPMRVVKATSELLNVLRVQPRLGRSFQRDEEVDEPNVVILSDGAWRTRLGASPDVLGKSLRLDGRLFSVVGVMPRGISFPDVGTEAWIPANPDRRFTTGPAGEVRVSIPQVSMVARLARGGTLDSVAGDVAHLMGGEPSSIVVSSLHKTLVSRLDQPLVALQCAVMLLFVMAGVNISTLQLTRGIERDRGQAVRLALGASRKWIVRALVVESGVVVLAGTVSGLALTWGLFRWLSGFATQIALASAPAPDAAVVLAGVVASLVVGLASSLPPALHFARPDIASRLSGSGHGSGRPVRTRGVAALVAVQAALSFVVVVAAASLAGTLLKVVTSDFGYERAGRVAVDVRLPSGGVESAQRVMLLDGLLDAGRQGGAPHSVSLASSLPVQDQGRLFALESGGPPTGIVLHISGRGTTRLVLVDPDYFDVMGIPRVSGRTFDAGDRGAGLVVVLSRSAARQEFGDETKATGREFGLGQRDQTATVIGVVGDVVGDPLQPANPASAYFPYFQAAASGLSPPSFVTLVGRGETFASFALHALPGRVAALAPLAEAGAPATLDRRVHRSLGPINFYAAAVCAFAALSLVLATLGVFAILSRRVAGRSREIAVRIAIGASPRMMFRDVLVDGLTLAACGVVAGTPLAWAVSRAAASSFTTSPPSLWWTLVVAAIVLLGSALFGCLTPAVRAMHVDPGQLARQE